ncbi:MAG: hypothetical protein ABIU87_10395 [Ornithinibacter sp.]
MTTLGVVIAFSTCIAWGSTREARAAVAVLAVGIGLAAVLGPIDLSIEGALSHVALLIGGWVIGWGVRERRELFALRETEAQHEAEAGWRRSGRSAARWTTWHFPSWSARFATR